MSEPTMTDLFMEAQEKGLWFYSPYQSLWFSPAELMTARAEGRFQWGPANWQLRDPSEYVAQAKSRLDEAKAAYEAAVRRTR